MPAPYAQSLRPWNAPRLARRFYHHAPFRETPPDLASRVLVALLPVRQPDDVGKVLEAYAFGRGDVLAREQPRENALERLRHRKKRSDGMKQDLVAQPREFAVRQDRRLAVFDDVGDKRHAFEPLGDCPDIRFGLRRLDEENIGAGGKEG